MKKLLISDYDGTFFINESDIRKNIKMLKQFRNAGNLFVIITSRSWKSIRKEIDKFGFDFDYMCCNMGAVIFDDNNNLIYTNYIDKNSQNIVDKMIQDTIGELSEKFEVTRFGVFENQSEYSNKVIGYKIKGRTESLEVLNNKLNEMQSKFDCILKKEESKLFINNKLDTKEICVKRLDENIINDEYKIITVGDDDVDFNMLKLYDGYRMKNSSKLVTDNIVKVVNSVGELLIL